MAESERVLRVAMVGCGYITRHHLKAYQRCGRANIVAVVDIRKENAEALAQETGSQPKVLNFLLTQTCTTHARKNARTQERTCTHARTHTHTFSKAFHSLHTHSIGHFFFLLLLILQG